MAKVGCLSHQEPSALLMLTLIAIGGFIGLPGQATGGNNFGGSDVVNCSNVLLDLKLDVLRVCNCTVEFGIIVKIVNCTAVGWDSDAAIQGNVLPDSLEALIISGNKIASLRPNLIGSCSNGSNGQYSALKLLDLSNNEIEEIDGKAFHCMPNLETLILDDNRYFINNHMRVFSNLMSLKTLSLNRVAHDPYYNNTDKFVKDLKQVFNTSHLNQLTELSLAGNNLHYVPKETFCSLKSLTKLDLSDNVISDPDFDFDGSGRHCSVPGNGKPCLPNLREINLSNNNIFILSEPFMNYIKNCSLSVDLHQNPYECDCDLIDTWNWLRDGPDAVSSFQDLECQFPEKLRGKHIVDLEETDLVCAAARSPLKSPIIIIGTLFGIIGILFLVVMYLNRKTIREHARNIAATLCAYEHRGYASVNNAV